MAIIFMGKKNLKIIYATLITSYTAREGLQKAGEEKLKQDSNGDYKKWNIEKLHVHAQSCLTFCAAVDSSPPGSSAHGIFQARTMGWGAISYSGRSSQPRDQTWVSYICRQIPYHHATQEAT